MPPRNRAELRHGSVEPIVYTLDQVLEAVPGLSRSELFRQMRSGQLPSLKVGRHRVVRRQDLERWVAERIETSA